MRYVIYESDECLGNAIFVYFTSCIFAIKYNKKITLKKDLSQKNDYIFIKGYDIESHDIYYNNVNDIDLLKTIANDNNKICCFNTLGFFKNYFNILELKETKYINFKNDHGIYYKTFITIDDENYFDILYNSDKIETDIYIKKSLCYLFDSIFIDNKNNILQYIESYKDTHYIQDNQNNSYLIKDIIDDILLEPTKRYDLVIHIQLNTVNEKTNFIEFEYYEKLFNNINFLSKKCAIVIQDVKTELDKLYLEKCLLWFNNNNIEIKIETNDIIIDFNIMKQCQILICSMSQLSWSAAYLSKTIKLCYMPNYNFYKIRNNYNKFFRKPIQNTIPYDVKTTLFNDIKVIILTLSEYPERINKLNDLFVKLNKIGLQYELFYGVNGKNININDTDNINIKLLNYNSEIYYYDITKNNRLMKKGEMGCALSHLKIYKKLVDDTIYDKYLILEDDVELIASLDDLYDIMCNIPNNFDMLHLAKSDWFPFIKYQKINNFFYDIHKRYFNRTTAYMISKNGANKLLNYTNNYINIPADDLLSHTVLNDNDFKFYVPQNFLFQEIENNNSIINKINNI